MRVLPLILLISALTTFGNQSYAQHLSSIAPGIGIGRLQVSMNKDIPLFRDENSKRPFDKIIFEVVATGEDKGKFLFHTEKGFDVKPFSYSPGNSKSEGDHNICMGLSYIAPHMAFRLVEETESAYRVVINEETFETAYVLKDPARIIYSKGMPYWTSSHPSTPRDGWWFLCESWEVFLKRMIKVDVRDQVLYDSIDGRKLDYTVYAVHVIELRGNWAKAKNHVNPGIDIWFKWTDGIHLLVRPVEEVYY